MQLRRFVALLLAVSLAGCFPLSIHPLYTDDKLVFDEELLGTWGEEGEPWTFERSRDKEYKVTLMQDKRPTVLSGHLVQLKKYQFLDLTIMEDPGLSEWEQIHLMPVHTFWQVDIEDDTLKIRTFDYDWLKDRFEKKRLWVSHEKVEDWFVLTAEPKRLQRFVLKWVGHKEAFGEWEEMPRMTSVPAPVEKP